jgi:hypothetical protein
MQNLNDPNELVNTNLEIISVGIFSIGIIMLDISTAAGFSCLFAVGMGVGTSLPARITCLLPALEAISDFRLTPSSIWKSLLQFTTNKTQNEVPSEHIEQVIITDTKTYGEQFTESGLEYLIDKGFDTMVKYTGSNTAMALGNLDILKADYNRQDNWFLTDINPKVHIDLYGKRTLHITDPELLDSIIKSYVKIHPMPQSQICLHQAFQKYLACGRTDCCLIDSFNDGSEDLLRDHYWSNLQDNTHTNTYGF